MTEILAYAIDYGTTNTLLRPIYKNAENKQESKQQEFAMKSILFCNENFSWTFGDQAIDAYTDDPMMGRLFKSIKRFMPESSFLGTQIYHKFFTIHELISVLLKHLRETANDYYQQDVSKVVLGHPALFSEDLESHKLAMQRLLASAKIAGFEEIEFCSEPIAAAYDYHQSIKEEKIILIVDLGGGTSDFTVCKLAPGEFRPDQVLSLHGVPVAGDHFDSNIMESKIVDYYGAQIQYKMPMSQNWLSLPKAFIGKLTRPADLLMLSNADSLRFIQDAQKYAQTQSDQNKLELLLSLIDERLGFALFREIEKVKIALSNAEQVPLQFSSFGHLHFSEQICKDEFIESSRYTVERIFKSLQETLDRAQTSHKEIDHVFITGGTSQIPVIQNKLRELFPGKITNGTVFQSVVAGLVEHGKVIFS